MASRKKESSSGESRQAKASGEKHEAKVREDPSLQSREYRDKDGNIHYHTKKYMEQHGKQD